MTTATLLRPRRWVRSWLPLLALLGRAAAAAPVYEQSFVVGPGRFAMSHGSSLVSVAPGHLLACWYAGSEEAAPDAQIYCADSEDSGRGWGQPRVVVARGERARGAWLSNHTVGNTVLHVAADGTLWLFYAAVPLGGWSGSHVDYKTSQDGGRTWTVASRLISGLGHLPRGKPLVRSGGEILLPLYRELLWIQGYVCTLRLAGGDVASRTCEDIPGTAHLQPALLAWRADGLLAYLRNRRGGQTLLSRQDPSQRVWQVPVAVELPNPDAPIDVTLTTDGRILAVYDDSARSRTPLSLAVSDDSTSFCKLWDFEDDLQREFSYPVLIAAGNGEYHLSYTYAGRSAIRHVHFNDEWLAQRQAAAGCMLKGGGAPRR